MHDRVKLVCISISPQSRASIASKYGLDSAQAYRKITWFLKNHLKVDRVLDIQTAKDISLLESAKEFVARQKANDLSLMPMLASACPGWICYAEKTHGTVLPLIDSTKSPQQIAGTLLKHHYAAKLHLTPDRIYHVTVMPCYDKKLEASRQDFYSDIYSTRDVDCVITTGELERLFNEQSMDIRTCPDAPSLDNMYIVYNSGFPSTSKMAPSVFQKALHQAVICHSSSVTLHSIFTTTIFHRQTFQTGLTG
jgi:iron only hydrogenase large subunit-like protein